MPVLLSNAVGDLISHTPTHSHRLDVRVVRPEGMQCMVSERSTRKKSGLWRTASRPLHSLAVAPLVTLSLPVSHAEDEGQEFVSPLTLASQYPLVGVL